MQLISKTIYQDSLTSEKIEIEKYLKADNSFFYRMKSQIGGMKTCFPVEEWRAKMYENERYIKL